MIDDLLIKKEKKNFYQINIKDDLQYKNVIINLKDCFLPFGLEEFQNKYYLNFEVDKQSEFYKLLRLIEGRLNNLIDSDDYELKSVFHKKAKYNLLCEGHVKCNKNVFITKFIENNKENSIFNIKKLLKYNLEVEISGIWVFKKLGGVYLNIKSISTNNNI